jgi:hypothetical protein
MPIPIELLSMFGGRVGADPGNGRPVAPAPSPAVAPPSSQGPQGPEEGRPPDHGNGRPA